VAALMTPINAEMRSSSPVAVSIAMH
jgi:hypothetical protein